MSLLCLFSDSPHWLRSWTVRSYWRNRCLVQAEHGQFLALHECGLPVHQNLIFFVLSGEAHFNIRGPVNGLNTPAVSEEMCSWAYGKWKATYNVAKGTFTRIKYLVMQRFGSWLPQLSYCLSGKTAVTWMFCIGIDICCLFIQFLFVLASGNSVDTYMFEWSQEGLEQLILRGPAFHDIGEYVAGEILGSLQ